MNSDYWLRFGCFLTGYNYGLLKSCSEVAAKTVKRYASALIIICIQWSFVGYKFTERYLSAGLLGSVAGGLVFMLIIIQVERQIIMSFSKGKLLYWFRGLIAVIMAVLGAIIIDQIIFKQDIEQKKILTLDEKVDKIYPAKARELQNQIRSLDSTINVKEIEWNRLSEEISQKPSINVVSVTRSKLPTTERVIDSSGNVTQNTKMVTSTSTTTNSVPNPKIALSETINGQLIYLRDQKASKDSLLLTLRPRIEEEIKSKVGFLDELDLMLALLIESLPALVVWFIWFLLLLGLELFILISKSGEEGSDYDALISHQMKMNKSKIDLFSRQSSEAFGRIE